MEEHFEAFANDGASLGLVPRSEVHRRGLWHRSAHVLVFARGGDQLLQKRALGKDLYAGCWDFAVGEHLKPGETFADGAARGVLEELGVAATPEAFGAPVRNAWEHPELGLADREIQQAFRWLSDGPFHPNPEEVAEVRFFAPEEIRRWLEARPDDFTPWFRPELERLGLL